MRRASFLALASMLVAGATAREPAPAPWAYTASALVKVRPGVHLAPQAEAKLEAGRGECADFQVVVDAGKALRGLEASATPLAGASGAVPLALSREAWLEVAHPSNLEGAPGAWPDALIPQVDPIANEARNAFPFDAPADRPTVLYAEACVPHGAVPGSYRGKVTLRAAGQAPLELPVSLEVLRYELPATSSLPNTFGFTVYTAAVGHGINPKDWERVQPLNERYARLALQHRISLYGMTWNSPPYRMQGDQAVIDFSEYDREVGPLLDGKAAPDGARFTAIDLRQPPGKPSDAERVAYWRAFAKHLREKGWLDRAFLYLPDEPTPARFGEVKHLAELAHKADPGIRTLLTASRQPALLGTADLWTPNINCMYRKGDGVEACQATATIADYAADRARGAHLWWYQSCMSHGCGPVKGKEASYFTGWPSYMVDAAMTQNRAMGVLAFGAGIEGELYFGTVEAFDKDPWRDQWRYDGNGDGTLFYPGSPARIGGKTDVPLASLRLKAIRDGLQDYELLKLAAANGLGDLARSTAAALAPQPWRIERDPATWEKARHALSQALDQTLQKKGAAPSKSAAR